MLVVSRAFCENACLCRVIGRLLSRKLLLAGFGIGVGDARRPLIAIPQKSRRPSRRPCCVSLLSLEPVGESNTNVLIHLSLKPAPGPSGVDRLVELP
jgi:hypothetical protein